MTENVSFPSRTGATVNGALALPLITGEAPAVVLLHEYWGLNDHIQRNGLKCRHLLLCCGSL